MNDQILPPQTDQTGQSQSQSNFFESLVGPGKKFSDQEALAKAKSDSDSYIKTLELRLDNAVADIKSLRETNNTQASLQEVLENIKSLKQTQSDNTLPPQSPQNNTPTLDPNKLNELFDQRIQAFDAKRAEGDNLKKVQDKIKEKWGTNVPTSVREQIEKLGELGSSMARKYPEEFLRTIGAETVQRQPDFMSPPRSGFNTDTFKPQGPQDRTWAWWEDLRKKEPNVYYSKKMAVQMDSDIQRLGDKFMDGDFNVDDKQLLASKYTN